jgi:NAD(P)-dependent dehydrogenase (short-subunit alcohol dehydrogenase family)
MRIKDQVAIITGAASGIGYATATRFAAEGAKVILADIVDASQPARALTEQGYQASFIKVDVSNEQEVESLFQSATAKYGRIDILVNNAGIELAKNITETTVAEWDHLINVNLKGVFLCARAAVSAMRQSSGGAIINVASELGLVGAPEIAAYCASKGGVIQLTKALAIDHAADGIRINCICPGPIETPLLSRIFESAAEPEQERRRNVEKTLLKRLGRPEEIANVILFLASAEASFMTGSVVVVDGGLTAE